MTVTEMSVRRLLKTHRATLWGRAFDISDDEGLNEAVQFIMAFLDELGAMNDHLSVRDRHAVL